MKVFITANGSLLKQNENEWYLYFEEPVKALFGNSPWRKIKTNPHVSETTNVSGFEVNIHTVNDTNYPYLTRIIVDDTLNKGSIFLDNGEAVEFHEIGGINPGLLTDDIMKRAEYAQIVKEQSSPPLSSHLKPKPTSKITSYTQLVEFAQGELKRLNSPFTFFARDKIKAINLALLKAELSGGFIGDEQLKETSYKLLAKDSGLIDALNMHRFSWSSKAKSKAPTQAIENMEKEAPGLSKII